MTTFSSSLGARDNAFGQPIGKALPDWTPRARLPDMALMGQVCRVLPYDPTYAPDLHRSMTRDDGRMWAYLPYGPFATADDLAASIQDYQKNRDFQTFVIITDEGALGYASFMRYDLTHGSVEVGGVTFSPSLQRSRAATEAMYLMMRHAFDHGYRRYEWKCDQLNAPSMQAAQRLGFQFEGVFRNAAVTRGRRRDTAWFSVIIEDWPQTRMRLETWLDPANFDASGGQKTPLSAIPLAL
ncbi:MAG TPA: GNAT family protein [Asticcacaulis sp.]|nr:GNAT family protein [Asticcacaulis sp.]